MMRLIALAALICASAAGAQSGSALPGAIAAGQVGERYDGYMGATATVSAEVRRQVAAVNLRRRNLYIELASRRNVTAEVVGITTACELLAKVGVGQSYMLSDGAWRRRAAGQAVALPSYCR